MKVFLKITSKAIMKKTISFFIVLLACLLMTGCSSIKAKQNLYKFAKFMNEDYSTRVAAQAWLAEEHWKRGHLKKALTLANEALEIGLREHGERNWATLHAMHIKGITLNSLGKYKEAESILTKTLALRREEQGYKEEYTLLTMVSLAETYLGLGKLKEADQLTTELLKTALEELGEKDPVTLWGMSLKGAVYRKQGKPREYETIMAKTVKLRIEVSGKQDRSTLYAMNGLAVANLEMGKRKKAELIYKKILELWMEKYGEKHNGTLLAMANLAFVYGIQGKLDEAETLYLKSLRIRKDTVGEKHSLTLWNMINFARNYEAQGRFDEAEAMCKKVLQLRLEVSGEKHPATIFSMVVLADLYKSRAQFDKAEPLLKKALTFHLEVFGKDHTETAEIFHSLYGLYSNQGLSIKADEYLQKALNSWRISLGKQHPRTLLVMANSTFFHIRQNEFEKAENILAKTMELAKTIDEDNPYIIDTCLDAKNFIFIKKKQFKQAENIFKIREKRIKSRPGYKEKNFWWLDLGFASFYMVQGKYEQAEPILKKVLTRYKEIYDISHPQLITVIRLLARSYQEQGKIDEASEMWSIFLRNSNDYLEKVLWAASEETRQSYLNNQTWAQNSYLSFHSQNRSPQTARETLYYSLTRKGLLLKISSEIKAVSKATRNPEIKDLAIRLRGKKQALANLSLSGSGKLKPEDHLRYINKLNEEMGELESQLGKVVKQYQLKKTKVIPKMVVNALPNASVLVDYLIFSEPENIMGDYKSRELMALVVNKHQSPAIQLVPLGEYGSVSQLVMSFNEEISNPDEFNIKDIKKTGKVLYNRLWKPLLPYLGDKKQVYLVPDGELNLLPFSALVQTDGKYLLQSTELNILSSSRDIVLQNSERSQNPSVIFSSPAYSTALVKNEISETRSISNVIARNMADLYFSPLPGTKVEGENINKMIADKGLQSNLFTNESASENNLKTVQSPYVLHLATHGFFLDNTPPPDQKDDRRAVINRSFRAIEKKGIPFIMKTKNPLLRSGLALSGANDDITGKKKEDETDGIFTAMEALSLELSGTKLVVLSACETGIGEIKTGEGVYGLRRSFQEAGAHSVMSTLWTISDEGTQVFMKKFYERFLDGESPQKALRQVQLASIKDEEWSHPFYWAPFVMVGKD